jgi:hypothetical protein
MSDFNQPTRRQNAQTPSSVTPPSGQQTRQTDQGSIERNPDAPSGRDAADPKGSRPIASKDDPNDPAGDTPSR